MDALNDSVLKLEEWHRQMAARLAVFAEHAEPSAELAGELSTLSARLGALAASAGQLAADAALAAARLQQEL